MNWLEDYEALRTNGELPDGLKSSGPARAAPRMGDLERVHLRLPHRPDAGKDGQLHAGGQARVFDGRRSRRCCLVCGNEIGPLRELDDETLGRFLAGLVQNLKNRGAVDEHDLAPYIEGLGNTWLLGKQNGRVSWRPNFSRASRSPVFLTSRGGERFQTLVRQPNNPTRTWYEDWLEKCFYAWTQPSPTRHRRSTRRCWADLRKQISSLNEMLGVRWFGVWSQMHSR